ncbi:ABC transporter ATP-binding protein [Leucobacter sp. W1038]|uniref:ABC transporter ATP-binding protein n=1 Tax=Leucobacter sp. W1038 TaxID=3438281 RepID=UPI003D960492
MKSLWNTLNELFKVLPTGSKRFYVGYSVLTGMLAILDSVALALIIVVSAPIATGRGLELPVIGEVPQSATPALVVAICVLFVSKSVFALVLHRRATRRFARYELEVGDRLFSSYIHSSWERRSQLSTPEVTRIVDTSMANTNLGFLLQISMIPGNVMTFFATILVLVIAQPVTALIAMVYLLGVALFMTRLVGRKAKRAGETNRNLVYRIATIMTEMVDALKEVTLRNKLGEISGVVSRERRVATDARADMAFLSQVPKYAFEAALILGVLLIGGVAYVMGGLGGATVAIGLFAVTGFRVLPALNGIQSCLTSAAANEVYALDVIRELTQDQPGDKVERIVADPRVLPAAPRQLELRGVSFRYPDAEEDVLDGISLTIPIGSSLAVVGPSGAGKSTLIDILLGLSEPTSGGLFLDDIPLPEVLAQWRRRVGYVPQRVALFDGTLAQNVALTWEAEYDPVRVHRALERAHLSALARGADGLNRRIGERGDAISGGQQQRIGIARALYSDPLVMVMDEATSSLDTATESRVTQSMRELQGEVTFITVAHRLATIREYDQVCYLDRGRIRGKGSFDEVVSQVPDFALQARLAGLAD